MQLRCHDTNCIIKPPTETASGVISTYAYQANRNRLASIAAPGQTTRSFTHDAAGDIVTDSRAGGLGMTFQYDTEGRVKKAFQTNAPANGGAYAYDGFNRLASRTVTKTTAPTSVTTLYVHDILLRMRRSENRFALFGRMRSTTSSPRPIRRA